MLNYRRIFDAIYRFLFDWPYMFEAAVALPSVILQAVISRDINIFQIEKDLAKNGEFDEDIREACGLCSHPLT